MTTHAMERDYKLALCARRGAPTIMIMMSRRLPAICVVFAAAAAGFGVHPLPSGDKSHRVAITLRVLGSPDDFSAGRKHHLRIEFAKLLEVAPQDVSAHARMEPAGTGTGTGPAAIGYPDDYNQEGRRLDACPGPTCASYEIEIVAKGAGPAAAAAATDSAPRALAHSPTHPPAAQVSPLWTPKRSCSW